MSVCSTIGSQLCFLLLLVTHPCIKRLYVHSLTSGVTGSCQKSYRTYSEASSVYQEIKVKGLLKIIRDPGDEVHFGSVEYAIQ